MKVIIHMGDPYPTEGPNAKRMRTFYEALISHGHEAYVLAPRSEGQVSGKGIVYFDSVSLTTKSSLNRLRNQMTIGFNSMKAARQIPDADVVITTSPPALINVFGWKIAKKKKARLIYDVRDIWPDVGWEMGSFRKNSLYSRVFEWNRNFMLKHSDLVMAVSKGKVKKLKAYRPSSDVISIQNGLDEAFLKNEENPALIKKYHLDEMYTCVYVGNLGLAQGLQQLLLIAEKAKDMPVQFLLFGSGVEGEQLKEYARAHNLTKVHFPGRLPNRDMFTILKHAGMSFVSLVNENLKDSVPTKMFEALGVGCPVLLAAVGDSADILNETGLGIAVRPNDGESLWRAFQTIYNTDYTDKKDKGIQVILERYSRQKEAERMVGELEKRFL